LRRRRCSDWRARFLADLMLAKVELRNRCRGVEKDANYAVDLPMRQSFRRCGTQKPRDRFQGSSAVRQHFAISRLL